MPVQTRSMTKTKTINEEHKFADASEYVMKKTNTLDTDAKILKAAGEFPMIASLAIGDEPKYAKLAYLKMLETLSGECFYYLLRLKMPSFSVEQIKTDRFQYYYRDETIEALEECFADLNKLIKKFRKDTI